MASVTATFAMDKEAVEFARAQEEAEAKIRAADAAREAKKNCLLSGPLVRAEVHRNRSRGSTTTE